MKSAMRPIIDVDALLLEEKKQLWRRRWLVRFMWGYVALLLIYWLFMIWVGDSWLPGALLLYGPRWPVLIPLVTLFFWALNATKWIIPPALVGTLLIVLPIMGFNVPIRAMLSPAGEDAAKFRVVTFNAGGGKFRPGAWEEYLLKMNADIVVCQEWPTTSPRPDHWKLGWYVQEQENNMLIASRYPIGKTTIINEKELGARGFVAAYEINTTTGPISMVNIHLPTIRGTAGELDEVIHGQTKSIKSLEGVMQRRQTAAHKAHDWTSALPGPLLIAGDFNMTTDSSLYAEVWSQYQNAFTNAGWGFGYSKWTRWHGVRIDHVLYDSHWRCIRAEVGPDVGSDHVPVIAEFLFTGGN